MNHYKGTMPVFDDLSETLESFKRLIKELTHFYSQCNQSFLQRIKVSPEIYRFYQETRNLHEKEQQQARELTLVEEPLLLADEDFNL